MTTDDSAPTAWAAGYSAALDTAERLLGFRLERFLGAAQSEPANGADFKRIATVHAFGATKEAIAEVFLQVAVYAGVARAFEGYQVATEVFEESAEH
jgi:4-carboxymuconolactone decarboxylase